jgi:hypothetical protein
MCSYNLELVLPSDFEFLYELCKSTMESYVVAAWGKWSDDIVRSQLLDGLNLKTFQSIFVDRSRVGAIAVERHATHIQIEAACDRLEASHPEAQIWMVRIGSRYVRRFGGRTKRAV